MTAEVKVVEGLDERYVDDALRVLYDAFAKKFRIGFRHADDLRRLFRDSVDRASCYTALVDGQFAGLLTIRTDGQEFYHLNMGSALHAVLAAAGDPYAAQSHAADRGQQGR